MHKPLSDQDNKDKDRQQEPTGTSPAADKNASPVSGPASGNSPQKPDFNNTAVGAYGPQANCQVDLSQKAWDESKNTGVAWKDDAKSRLAIRLFSRGVMGAAFFTAGGLLTKKWMNSASHSYDANKPFSQQTNPLQIIAKAIDTGVGKPIEAVVGAVAGKEMGMSAVRFRPTRYHTFGKEMRGRSLGDEAVNITFDFFCASVGDAWGRDIAGWFDPHVKKNWVDDKGRIVFPKALDNTLRSLTRYITYNGGEDWAVAIPYAYFMKAQRAGIEHLSPGFKYDFDRQLNGGSFKMKDNRIVGNFNKEGMLDLQGRFTAYNVGTLMYRELYDHVEHWMHGKRDNLYGAPDKPEKTDILGRMGDLAKWMARSVVKGVVIMTPSVPFFWITRTPQTKYRGLFIDQEKGVLGMPKNPATGFTGDSIHANTPLPSLNTPLDYWQHVPNPREKDLAKHSIISGLTTAGAVDPSLVRVPGSGNNSFDAYKKTFGMVDKGFNAFGKASYDLAHATDGPAAWADRNLGVVGTTFKDALGIHKRDPKTPTLLATDSFNRFSRPMMHAAVSYTPYMYAKAEFANLWDNGKMDMAAERLIDGAASLNWGEFKAGAGEIWNAFLHKPMSDPVREAEGRRRMQMDTSPPDVFDRTQVEQARHKKKISGNWRERVVSGPPVEKTIIAAREEEEKAKPQKSGSYAEQEAMRKALEELSPPTNSIN
jgi:hypothetical protein